VARCCDVKAGTGPVPTLNGDETQGVAAAGARARRATRQPIVAAPNSTSDAIRNAAPGCGSHASGPTEMAYTAPKNSGDSTPAIAPTLLFAPCSCPCSDSETSRVMSDWMVGIANPHSALGS